MKKYKKYSFEEEIIKNYLKKMASFNFNNSQKDFFMWQAKIAKEIKLKSYTINSDLEIIIQNFLKRNRIKVKECYYNSWKLTSFNRNIQYVEGFRNIFSLPISHAWNCYKGIYFDLTTEIILKDDINKFEFVKIIQLTQSEMFKYSNKTGLAGEYIGEYYEDKILKGKNV